ncbi:unnamed protein product [Calypogeia fissa]
MAKQKVAIVTGANTGIGRETALALAKDDVKVFITCRDWDKGREAVKYIQDACPTADVEIILLDLKTLDSVRRAAAEFKSKKLPLNILVNNAGSAMGKPWYTAEGVGGSAQVNYLGAYAFTRLLEEELTLGAPSRVVNVSSITHRHASIETAVKFLKNFKAGLYAECKLASVLFTHEAQRQWQGKGIESASVDPGAVWSDIWRRSKFNKPPFSWLLKVCYAPTWDGAKPVIYAATAPYDPPKKEKEPVRFFARGCFASPLVTYPIPGGQLIHVIASFLDWPIRKFSRGAFCSQIKDVPAAPIAYDKNLASSLWKESAIIVGLDDK